MPPLMHPTILLYDWDNTLVDGWAGIAAALNAVFAAFAMPAMDRGGHPARVRVSLRDSFPVMFGADWERARDIFFATLEARHLHHVTPMPGAAEALAAGAAWPQGVVSNKAGRFLRAEVAHLGWAGISAPWSAPATRLPTSRIPRRSCWRSIGLAARPTARSGIWATRRWTWQAARAAGVTAVLVGDASHDGGIDRARPDLHFPTALDLAARLRALA